MSRPLELRELALNMESAGFHRIGPDHPLFRAPPRRKNPAGRNLNSPCPICNDTGRTLIVFAEFHHNKAKHFASCSGCSNCEEL